MAIKVHGNATSPGVQRVIACLEEKGLQYEHVPIDFATDQHKKEPFISINPFGQIPALEDGDLKLFESRAITRYLEHQYATKGTPLTPQRDIKKMAIAYVWMEVEAHQFESVVLKLTQELVVKPIKGIACDEAIVQENEQKLAKVLDVYESHLAQNKYLAGEAYSLADLHHAPFINYLFGTKYKPLFDARPHVNAWGADILARPSWAKVVEKLRR